MDDDGRPAEPDAGSWQGAPSAAADPPSAVRIGADVVARAAVLAMFIALIVHTLAYAGFYEDPITWVLLAIAGSLAIRPSA